MKRDARTSGTTTGEGRPARRRLRGAIAAASIGALALLGATPAFAEGEDSVSAQSASLAWSAVDSAGASVAGAAFRVEGPATGSDGAEDWSAAVSGVVIDDTGAGGYTGADLDPAPGAIRIAELVSERTGATHAVADGERFRILAAATDEALAAGGEWQRAAAGPAASAGAAEPGTRIIVPVAPAAPEPPVEEQAPEEQTPEEQTPEEQSPGEDTPGEETPGETSETVEPADADEVEVAPFAAGPDGPGVVAPYVHWRATDGAGNLVPGAAFRIQGPKQNGNSDTGNSNWGGNSRIFSVEDNTGQPGYSGRDLDPDPGEFVVKQLTTANPAAERSIRSDARYRVQQVSAPGGYEPPSTTAWRTIPAASGTSAAPASSAWVAGVHDFGEFVTPPITAPYLVWKVAQTDGSPAGGATVTLQGPVLFGTLWGNAYAVPDCTAGPCTGLDVDPAPGSFRVKYLTPATNPTATPVAAGSRYRVALATAPQGLEPVSTAWVEIPGSGASGTWNSGAGAETHDFGTLAVSAPAPATITVRTGGDRTGTTGVTDLAGVVLHLNTGSGSASGVRPDGVAGDGPGWARCVSDASGVCSFAVPDAGSGGANRDARFWVVQQSAPAGWYTNPALRTGGGTGSGSSSDYEFRTGTQLRAGGTYSSTADFMASTDGSVTNSGGVWQNSRNNALIAQGCGLDVALIMDLSGSVDGYEDDLREAADIFVDSLSGTQSRMALFSFSNSSPANDATQNYPALTSVATAEQAEAFKARYANWDADGGTNWDRGLATAAASNTSGNHYEVAVVITDGSPTYFGTGPSGNGNTNRFLETENGVFSANLLKSAGTRVIAFGVGAGATGSANALNLRAISGPASGSDYFETSDYAGAGQELRNLALGACAGQLNVTKMIVPNTAPAGSIQGAEPADAGWSFTASDPGAGLALPDPATRTTIADATGTVGFPLDFAGGTTSAAITVTEAQQPGYTIVPVDGQHAVCRNLNTGDPVTPIGSPTDGFRVVVPSTQTVTCTVYNRAPDEASTVSVEKVWVVEDPDGGVVGEYRLPGDEGLVPAGLAATLMLSDPEDSVERAHPWGSTRSGYRASGSVRISEQASADPELLPGCAIVSQRATARNGAEISEALPYEPALEPGANAFEITNTVVCDQTLELVKVVDHGSVAASAWTLDAAAPDGALPGPSGAYTAPGSVTASVTADVVYDLAEQGSPALVAYVQHGDWGCVQADGGDGAPISLDASGGIRVPLGQRVTCTVHNTTAELTVFKDVAEGAQDPDRWTLDGAPAAGVAGLAEAHWTGRSSGSPSTAGETVVEVRPGHTYTLSERVADGSVLSYLLTRVQKWDGDAWVDVPKSAAGTVDVTVPAGEHAYYRFVNTVAPSVALPLTGGIGAEAVMLGGAGIGLLAALLGVLHHRRRRRGTVIA